MAVEIPSSLIRQLQAALRKQAGVPAYDPADPGLRPLPPAAEVIAGLDPSAPPYLRCKECRAALLRGVQSTVCVFCGAEQRREGPPPSIPFNTTLGCRRLLRSLDLDGSEVIAPNTEPRDSGKGQSREKEGLVLSNLLDIELRWPSEGEKVRSSSSNNASTQSVLNLSGVDLDTFFSETKKEIGSSAHHVSDEILEPEKETVLEDFGLFDELRSSGKAVDSVKTKSSGFSKSFGDSLETKPSDFGDSSGAWEAEFQAASSQISATDPNSENFFQDSFPSNSAHAPAEATGPNSKDFCQDSFSSNSASAPAEEQFSIGSGMSREDKHGEISSTSSQRPSMNDNWPLDVLWHTADSAVPSAAEQFSGKSNADDNGVKPNSMTHDWDQTDRWPKSNTNMLSTSENIQSKDDSSDDWQDFSSSGNAPDGLSNSWTQASTAATSSNEHELGISSGSFTEKLEDMDFGSFVQSDMLPGLLDLRKDPKKVDIMRSEASVPGRMSPDRWSVTDKNEILSSTQSTENVNADVQALLSQMPDLSFMLEDELSIPKKVELSG